MDLICFPGKTTLLSCIVGMTELDQGECLIFGLKPGANGCGVPGRRVGYMPQVGDSFIERRYLIMHASGNCLLFLL